jgi:hypothetical protein
MCLVHLFLFDLLKKESAMGVRFWVGKEAEFEILNDRGVPVGKIAGCILTLSKAADGVFAMVDTGKEVRTVRLEYHPLPVG